jgi:hypothetical protein
MSKKVFDESKKKKKSKTKMKQKQKQKQSVSVVVHVDNSRRTKAREPSAKKEQVQQAPVPYTQYVPIYQQTRPPENYTQQSSIAVQPAVKQQELKTPSQPPTLSLRETEVAERLEPITQSQRVPRQPKQEIQEISQAPSFYQPIRTIQQQPPLITPQPILQPTQQQEIRTIFSQEPQRRQLRLDERPNVQLLKPRTEQPLLKEDTLEPKLKNDEPQLKGSDVLDEIISEALNEQIPSIERIIYKATEPRGVKYNRSQVMEWIERKGEYNPLTKYKIKRNNPTSKNIEKWAEYYGMEVDF